MTVATNVLSNQDGLVTLLQILQLAPKYVEMAKMLLERFVMTVIMMEHQVVLQIAQVLCLGIYVKEEPLQPL